MKAQPTIRSILIDVSPAELLDKIAILRIKLRRLTDQTKLLNVEAELHPLEETLRPSPPSPASPFLVFKKERAPRKPPPHRPGCG